MVEAKRVVKSGLSAAVASCFEYDTPKIVHINSKKVGVINRFVQLTIIGYIIGYVIVWNKGYQQFENVESAVTTKLKGVVYTNLSELHIPGISNRIWDVADYVIPAEENDAFFVMTNVIVTMNQSQGQCDEDPSMPGVNCTRHTDCKAGEAVVNGNGVKTGKCVPSSQNSTLRVCEIYAWCPVEVDKLPTPGKAILEDSKKFTVLIKNQIEFPMFAVKRRNIQETQNSSYLKSCHFNSDHEYDRLCPIFRLQTIVESSGENYEQMAVEGGIMAINIHWDCNLDYDISYCTPAYTFHRLDNKDAKIAKGWNFRYANFYQENGTTHRDLYKAYGIRYVLKVTGRAGKFNVIPLLLNIGSGLGLLAIATVLCDLVVLYLLKKAEFYRQKKYLYVTGDDAFSGIFDSSQQDYGSTQRQVEDEDASVRNRTIAPSARLGEYSTFDQ